MNSALWGTIWVISLTAIIAFPIGVGAAIFLEEYAPKTRWTKALQVNISNLAGVPSVVYGLLGLGIFVQFMNLGRVVLAGALTMALLSLPVIIISSQEAIRAVPLSPAPGGIWGRRDTLAGGPAPCPAGGVPGILTGTILAVSRAIGETAPVARRRRVGLHRHPARRLLRRLHRVADADLRMDAALARRVQERTRAGRNHRPARGTASDELRRHHPSSETQQEESAMSTVLARPVVGYQAQRAPIVLLTRPPRIRQ